MQEYVIISDATADLPEALASQYQIPRIAMPYIVGNDTFHFHSDWTDAQFAKFYTELRNGITASTSQITPATYQDMFEPYFKAGVDILYISFSSGLSGTIQSATLTGSELMETYPGRRFICVDSLSATFGEGLCVLEAARNKEAGMSLQANAEQLVKDMHTFVHWFTVDDLMYLKRGGRASAASALLGTTLQIKPVMHVDAEGHLTVVEKTQGRKSSLKTLARKMANSIVEPGKQCVFIGHCDALKDAQFLEARVRESVPVRDVYVGNMSPIIGAHAGPGTIALFFYGTER